MLNKLSRVAQPSRPYQAFRIEDLHVTVTVTWNSTDSLKSILQELMRRKTKRAFRLQRKIEKRIVELTGVSKHARTEDTMLFAAVGLHPSAPDFLIEAARKAYCDNNSHASKATEAFGNIEEAFNRIYERVQ